MNPKLISYLISHEVIKAVKMLSLIHTYEADAEAGADADVSTV